MGFLRRFRSIVGGGQQPEGREPRAEAATRPPLNPRPIVESDLSGEAFDEAATRELFGAIAARRAEPIKQFIVELRHGPVSKDHIDICLPVVDTLIDGAESVELRSVQQPLLKFREALWVARTGDGSRIDSDARHLVLPLYDELVAALPETFAIDEGTHGAESAVLHAVLRQLPEIGLVTLEKLYAAGLTSLEALYLASPEELESATGIRSWLCERICEKAQEHREGTRQSADKNPLATLVEELRRQHEATESSDYGSGSRIESMRNRKACSFQVDAILVEMGETDLVDELRRMAFALRLERLENFLDSHPALQNIQQNSAGPAVGRD